MMVRPPVYLRTVLEVRQVPARGWRLGVTVGGEPVLEAGKRWALLRGTRCCGGLCSGLADVLVDLISQSD